MAAIDYKEKYEQALERARQFSEKPYLEDSAGIVEYIFPELKESEDERIRKEITELVMLPTWETETEFYRRKELVAWLEKQRSKDKFIEKELGCIKGYRENAIKRLEELEKQGKKKSEEEVDNLHNYLYGEQESDDKKGMNLVEEEMTPFQKKVFCIIDTTIEEEQGLKQVCDELLRLAHNEIMQNPAWSEEDEKTINNICHIIRQYDKISKRENKPCWYIGDCLLWMQNIKDRVQPKQEWSEEDETIYQSIMDDTVQENQLNDKQTDWLRDIKYRHFSQSKSQWKPSEDQLFVLEFVADRIPDKQYEIIVRELISDLKKL